MMNIVNLTPHDITIMNEEGETVRVVLASGNVARLDSDKEIVNRRDGIDFYHTSYGIPVCLNSSGKSVQFPEQKRNTIYVVSGLFRSGYSRPDLWQPGELLRDEEGRPTGCIGLSQ
jgi:hypothetical protein